MRMSFQRGSDDDERVRQPNPETVCQPNPTDGVYAFVAKLLKPGAVMTLVGSSKSSASTAPDFGYVSTGSPDPVGFAWPLSAFTIHREVSTTSKACDGTSCERDRRSPSSQR